MRKLSLFVLTLVSAWALAADSDLPNVRDRQAAVQADTEQLSRRLATMLRVMEHYKLDTNAEQKLLKDAAATLNGLSQVQMNDVLGKLDAAMKAADDEAAGKNVEAAYDGHRDALRKLKGLLGRYDAIRDLDSAVARLERLARDELELSFRMGDILQDSLDGLSADPVRRRRVIRIDFPTNRARREAEEQADYRKEFDTIWTQLAGLKSSLRADHLERLQRAEQWTKTAEVPAKLVDLYNRILPVGFLEQRHRDWALAEDQGWAVASSVQEVAQSLRGNVDKLQALREARHKLVSVIDQTGMLAKGTVDFFANPPEQKPVVAPVLFARRVAVEDPIVTRSRQFADENGRQGLAARAIQCAIAVHAPPIAATIGRAAETLHHTDLALRQVAPLFACAYASWAEAQLRDALTEIDRAIATTEKERSDPLSATQAALQQVEQLIKEQTQLRDQTVENDLSKNNEAAKQQAPKQQQLAQQTHEVAQMPLPTTPNTKEALKQAEKAMEAAAKDLNQQQPKQATNKQNEALAKLEEAKQELSDQAKKIEQRRDEIAMLEEAQKKLAELGKQEQAVADKAKEAAPKTKPEGQDAAQMQEKVTPPTKEVAKDLQQPAPEAAKWADRAAEKMEAAKADLDKNMNKEGEKKAQEAVKDLKRAENRVKEALDERKAQEALDQMKLQPNQLDALQAAMEVAKAAEATDLAEKFSKEAMENPVMKDLAERQQKVADMAKEKGQQKAADPAKKAAEDLQKGEFQKALAEQQKALSQMQKADGKQPGELSNEQKSIMQATEAMAKSQESTQMAREALQQALAQSPDAFKDQLQKAQQQLDQAGQQLQKGQPQPANQAQNQAKQSLEQMMQSLEKAAEMAKNLPQPQPGQQPGEQPGQQPGEQPGEKSKQRNERSQERNDQRAEDNREPDGAAKNAKAELNKVEGDGTFLNLPPRQRELIKQALTEKLPPEYASYIQQYFVNVAKGKPAAKPAAEPVRDK